MAAKLESLQDLFAGRLHLQFAEAKTFLLGTSKEVCQLFMKTWADFKGSCVQEVRRLGADYSLRLRGRKARST
eukprot:12887454-Prorocentrum_lima.AAC.1